MTPKEVRAKLKKHIVPVREDIARAKHFICQADPDKINDLVHEWLRQHNLEAPDVLSAEGMTDPDVFAKIVRSYSLRMAFHHAVWELVAAGELIPMPAEPKGGCNYSGGGPVAIPINDFETVYLPAVRRVPSVDGMSCDPDIFLQGIKCKALHPGIREAIDQALGCFRRGLYMPATAMLAAGAEATWTECGEAVAKKLAKPNLAATLKDPHVGIGKKVVEIRKTLEVDGKVLLKDAGQPIGKVTDTELWTITLRDRRNALHWAKTRSFVAAHSDTAVLLLAAPLHLGTLESIRQAC